MEREAFEERESGRLSVVDFRAVGDGVADDAAAVQAAVDAAGARKEIVYFPVGTYRVLGLGPRGRMEESVCPTR